MASEMTFLPFFILSFFPSDFVHVFEWEHCVLTMTRPRTRTNLCLFLKD